MGQDDPARRIGEQTVPWHSVDDEIGWRPGWVGRPTPDQRGLAAEIAAGDAWMWPLPSVADQPARLEHRCRQQRFDERYGEGVVEVDAALRPVEG